MLELILIAVFVGVCFQAYTWYRTFHGILRGAQEIQAAIMRQQQLAAMAWMELDHNLKAQQEIVGTSQNLAAAIPKLDPAQQQQTMHDLTLVLAQLANRPAGRWSNGAYFESGNVYIPGGPALVNGQLHIPR